MTRSLAITGATLLAHADATPTPHTTILIENTRIAAIATGDDGVALVTRAAERYDAAGALVLPGFVNAHHHSYSNVLRGTENAMPLELWALFTIAYGRAFDAEMVRLAILLGAADMLRAGVTAVIDHSPQLRFVRESLAAHRESGMRVGFAAFFNDLHDHDILGLTIPSELRSRLSGPGFATPEQVATMFRELAAEVRGDPRVRVMLGPNAPQRCSDALLDLWPRLRDELGLSSHTHLLETKAQAIAARRRWPAGIVRELDRRGLLDEHLSVAHGIWLDRDERALLAKRVVTVVHNPSSNLMLGSGAIDFIDYRAQGARLALGSDSANTGGGADPFELMRLALMLPRLGEPDWRCWPSARDVLRAAGEGAAAALGHADELGRIEIGRLADLAIIDLASAATIAPRFSPESIVQHGGAAHVCATLIGGDFAYRDDRILAFDAIAVRDGFRDRIEEFLDRAAPAHATAREALDVFAAQLDVMNS